ncbi:MAG: response regulator transcription factor [Lachnospiraceae bacterium]|nr:response regulator transcription factor [Lachnospiraceae bacterium]
MAKIIIVDDDKDIRWGIYRLLKDRYAVLAFSTGEEALSAVRTGQADLCLLDVNLPDMNGFELCRKIREISIIPIIFITVNDDEASLEEGILSGGDDYIRKPFSSRELMLRVLAQLRREEYQKKSEEKILTRGPYSLNLSEHSFNVAGEPCILTENEYNLLLCLMRRSGCLVTRNILLSEIWDMNGRDVENSNLTVCISRLRKKLIKMSGRDPVRTIKGVGYRFNPVQEER